MKLKNLTADVLKEELKKHRWENTKEGISFDRAYIDQLEEEYSMRFIGAHVCKDKLNFQVHISKDGSDNYTTATISIPDFRNSTTALVFANVVCNLVYERAEIKESGRYLQMQNKVAELEAKEKQEVTNKLNARLDGRVKGEPALYDANYFKQFKKQPEPSLEELTLTLNAIKSMPHISVIRAQIAPIRSVVKQYAMGYAT